MTFSAFSRYLEKLESISSRLAITQTLADLYHQLSSEEVVPASYLLQGQLLPKYQGLEFQVAIKTILKALARVMPSDASSSEESGSVSLFGESDFSDQEASVEKAYKKLGDLGKLTADILVDQKPHQQISILNVYDLLKVLAEDAGEGSQQRKLEALVQVYKKLDGLSAKFVTRIILGRLRLGFSDMTMIDALSWAMTGTKDEHQVLEDAYQTKADIGKLAQTYLAHKDQSKRLEALANYQVEVGVPVIPALCQRLNSAQEIIDKMGDVIAEPKYDGLRVQIHVWRDQSGHKKYRTFTRNLEETSHMFPELETAIKDLACESCILDAEGIGFDPATGKLLAFQDTIQRKRKHQVSQKASEIPVRFYVFDLLALNGQDLLKKPLFERKELLQKLLGKHQTLIFSQGLHTADPQELHNFHEAQLAADLEGAVIKQYNAVYQSGRKGWSWVKIKEAEGKKGKLSDTLDLIVMGYYFGRGKRAEFGIGAILVGILDEQDQVKTISKIGTGLSDEQLRETKKRCDQLKTQTQPQLYQVAEALKPDVWCEPGFVMEIAADELTTSPQHSAGVALRFPRLVKFRDDKTWQEATKVFELKGMQAVVKFYKEEN
jgi:DNA ligase-1